MPLQGLFAQPFAVSYQIVGDYLLTWLSLDPRTVISYLFRKDYDAICVKGTFIRPFLPNLRAFVPFSCLTALGRAFIMVLKKKEKNGEAFEVLTVNCYSNCRVFSVS